MSNIGIVKGNFIKNSKSKAEDSGASVSKSVVEMATQVTETEEEFIFQTLNNFAERDYKITVEKKELIDAIRLIRMYKEQGMNPIEKINADICLAEAVKDAYQRGFKDGSKNECREILQMMIDIYVKEDEANGGK